MGSSNCRNVRNRTLGTTRNYPGSQVIPDRGVVQRHASVRNSDVPCAGSRDIIRHPKYPRMANSRSTPRMVESRSYPRMANRVIPLGFRTGPVLRCQRRRVSQVDRSALALVVDVGHPCSKRRARISRRIPETSSNRRKTDRHGRNVHRQKLALLHHGSMTPDANHLPAVGPRPCRNIHLGGIEAERGLEIGAAAESDAVAPGNVEGVDRPGQSELTVGVESRTDSGRRGAEIRRGCSSTTETRSCPCWRDRCWPR